MKDLKTNLKTEELPEEQLNLFSKMELSKETKGYSPRPEVSAEMLAKDILKHPSAIKFGWSKEASETIAEEYLLTFGDGYELAKELDRSHYWDITRDEMEALDDVFFIHNRTKYKLDKEWAKNFEPAYKVHEVVEFEWDSKIAKGIITEILDTGHYVISIKDKNGMPIVKWEDVQDVQDVQNAQESE